MNYQNKEEIEIKYNLLNATKKEAMEIIQFLIMFFKLDKNDFDWSTE